MGKTREHGDASSGLFCTQVGRSMYHRKSCVAASQLNLAGASF